jgi:ATP-binding cassette subfamily F protein 3
LLVEALNKYEGTIILVSHDRYFISKAANKIWEIVDGQIKEFKGTYAEWVEWNERMAAKSGAQKKDEKEKEKEKQKHAALPSQPKQSIPEQKTAVSKETKKELQKQQKLFQQYEERIAQLKEEKKKLEAALSSPDVYSDKNKYTKTETEYKKIESELTNLNRNYEQVFDKIVELENNVQNT